VGATEDGYLRVDRRAVAAEAHLDGKFVLRTSDQRLTAAEVALGYKQLLEVKRGWRDLKHHLDLRPVYHHKEDGIRAHVVLCWLSLVRDQQLCRVLVTNSAEFPGGESHLTTAGPPLRVVGSW